jgi:hypothetical protein
MQPGWGPNPAPTTPLSTAPPMRPISTTPQSNPYEKVFSNGNGQNTQPKFIGNPGTASNAQRPPPNRYQNESYQGLQNSDITSRLRGLSNNDPSHDLSHDGAPEVRGVRWGGVDTRDIPADNRGRRVPNRGDEERGGEGSDGGRERGNEWGGGRSDRGSERGDEREVRGDERGRWRDDGGSEEGDERGGRGERRGDGGGGGGDGGGSGGGEGNRGGGDRGRGNGGRRTGSDGQSHDANEIMNNRDFGSFRRNSAADRSQDDVDPLGVSSLTMSTSQAGGDNSRVGTTTSQGVDDIINDDLVRRTRRQFKQDWFHERQQPYEHLEAERLAHLNLATCYSSANQKTRVQIIIAMCSNKLMLLSQEIVEAHGSFVDTTAFLKALREERFPNFGPQCEVLYKNCFQKSSESTRQYASRFKDVCMESSKNPDKFVDDFVERLRTYLTKKTILTTFYSHGERTLERVAQQAEQTEIYHQLHQSDSGRDQEDKSTRRSFKRRSFRSRSKSQSPSKYQRETRIVNEVEMSCLKDAALHEDNPIPGEEDDCEFLWGVGQTKILRLSKDVRTWENKTRKCRKKHTLRGSCWRCGGDRKTHQAFECRAKECQICKEPLDDHKTQTVAGCGKCPQNDEAKDRISCGDSK